MQGPMIKASTTPNPTGVEVEECLWTDRGLVIIMIAVEMVMGGGGDCYGLEGLPGVVLIAVN